MRWESEAVERLDRRDAWSDALNSVYGSWSLDHVSTDDFRAHMVHHASGGLQIVECVCDPCSATRTRANISHDDQESLTIQVVLSGRESFTIGERQILLGQGDVLIWNSTRPMKFEVTERLRKISVTFPLTRLRSWLPTRWHSIESSLPKISEKAHLLTSFIELVTPAYLAGSLSQGEALTESLMGLLVNVLEDDRSQPATLRGVQLKSVKDYIDQNLSDVELSVSSIAIAKKISLRYLHALFQEEGTSVQRYIFRERLLRCARELDNPLMLNRTVTEIAFSWGFQNSTHFSRKFKEEFGLPPTEYRRDHAVRQGELRRRSAG